MAKKKTTAVIFRNDDNGEKVVVVHTIHGDRIHQRVARWLKRKGLSMENHDYYVTSS